MARAQMRQRAQQAGRIGMQRPHQRVVDRGILDHLAGIHRDHARAGLGDDAEVVRDQHQRRVRGFAEVAQQFQNLRLHGDVERGGRLVGDQELRPADQRRRDHHALAHAAGELVRIVVDAPLRRGDADAAQHLDGPRPRLLLADVGVDAQRLGDLVADGKHRIERAHRLLKDHRDAAAADRAHRAGAARGEIDAVEHDRAVEAGEIVRQQPQDRKAGDGLAAAAFADDADAFARRDVEIDLARRLPDALRGLEADAEPAHRHQRLRSAAAAASDLRCAGRAAAISPPPVSSLSRVVLPSASRCR